jgi:hypothetical protein
MISEVTVEKRFQSRAFMILPLSFNVAGVVGPSEWKLSRKDHLPVVLTAAM